MKLEFKNKKWGVIGLGKSGLASANYLKAHGADVFVSDSKPESVISGTLSNLSPGIAVETGKHTDKILDSGFIMISPGVPKDLPVIDLIRRKGIPVVSELELAYWQIKKGIIIAVTGTNGKTTTVHMIKHLLDTAGLKSVLCGNVGVPVSEIAHSVEKDSYVVIEVSSFQLEDIFDFRADYSMILNITPDHFERYDGSMDKYKNAKYRIFENAKASDTVIINRDDSILSKDWDRLSTGTPARVISVMKQKDDLSSGTGGFLMKDRISFFSGAGGIFSFNTSGLNLLGEHNVYNSMFAVIPLLLENVPEKKIIEGLTTFKPVSHRLEKINIGGRLFIDDSKATNVDSVLVALESFQGKIVLILGGRDKGSSYAPLRRQIMEKVRLLLVNGEAREKILRDLSDTVPAISHPLLKDNIDYLKNDLHPGETVLFSPACSSYDQFKNYAERGDFFKEYAESVFGK